ncbi:hypothetical protein APHMUC_0443 [Anaplasma phagocytophilum str. ApMUC09]|uniref:Uncharacterized protein n=1 Tax=Anaplasma phagocytophilum str. ApMUC09 TaxID=1359152 RepID=A0A0F3NBU7_ANAPH|nr:hypothetical protein APHMUC_0443 [Anaplasma phagocytophilum str. ApMUC09]SCV61724.1 hypothetical protein ANAPH2_00066 [Anaplasma phagocytophilum]
MRKIVEEITNEILCPDGQRDVRVVNEVVVRAIIRAIFKGMAQKYILRVHPTFHGLRYSYDVTTPGAEIGVPRMREACAVAALKRSIASEEGMENLCRYLVAICAFMPQERKALMRSLLAPSSPAYALREAVLDVCDVVDAILRHTGNISEEYTLNWDEVYKTCSRKLLKAMSKMSDSALVGVAYAIYTSSTCMNLTRSRDDLLALLSMDEPLDPDYVSSVAGKLRLLSNFNPRLTKHYKIRGSVLSGGSESVATLAFSRVELLASLKNDDEWPHIVNSKVSAQIRKSAAVSAEKLLLVSVLLNNEIGITTGNVGAMLFNSGRVGYSFNTSASFALLKQSYTYHKLSDGLLSSAEGKELVDLLLESHHTRQRCSFGVDYEALAEEIRRLSDDAVEGGILLSNIVSNICEGVCRQDTDRKKIMAHAKEIALLLFERIKFLRNFVDNPQYKDLTEFIMQSNVVDTHVDFRNFLERRGVGKGVERRKGRWLPRVPKTEVSPVSRYLNRAMYIFGIFLAVCAALSVLYALGLYMLHGSDAIPFESIGGLLGITLSIQSVFVLSFVAATLGFLCISFACVNMRQSAAVDSEDRVPLLHGDRESRDRDGSKPREEYALNASDLKTIDAVGCIGTASAISAMEEPANENAESEYVDVLPPRGRSSRISSRSGHGSGGVSR